jgi:AcrR family transcriptional regulator
MADSQPRPRYVPGPSRGDQRRAALLAALEDLLSTRALDRIGIADIARAAGLTRSAFYFYFPTKAAAVAALLADLYEDMQQASAAWYDGGAGTPIERMRTGFEASSTLWRERAGLLVAMFDAIGTDREVRKVWDAWVGAFIERISERIAEDRRTGLAGGSADPRALATVLMGAALYTAERDARALVAGEQPDESLTTTLNEIWRLTIYQAD